MTWDFWQRARAFLRPGVRVLLAGRGGLGQLLASGHPPALLSLALPPEDCPRQEKRLGPLGAEVRPWRPGEALPFAEGSMGLMLCFHQPLDLEEARRVLKPGGFLLTEQVGGSDGDAAALGLALSYNLENWQPRFLQAGFRVVQAGQWYGYEGGALRHRFTVTAGRRAGGPDKKEGGRGC